MKSIGYFDFSTPWRRHIGLSLAENIYGPIMMDLSVMSSVYVLYEHSTVRGFCLVERGSETQCRNIRVHLLFIKPECRHRGLGSFLMYSMMRMEERTARILHGVIHYKIELEAGDKEEWLTEYFRKFGFIIDAEREFSRLCKNNEEDKPCRQMCKFMIL